MSASFPVSVRIHTSKAYTLVFQHEERRRYHSKRFTTLSVNNKEKHPRLGIIVAKKHVKSAVKRNLIKRVVRESFREHQSKLPPVDIVVLAKSNCLSKCGNEATNAWFKRKLSKDIKRQWAFLIGE